MDRRRLAQIAALGLVWAIALGVLVADRAGIGTRSTAKPPSHALPVVPAVVDTSRVPLDHGRLLVASFRSREEGFVTDDRGGAFHSGDGGLSFHRLPANGSSLAIRETSRQFDLTAGHVNRIEWLSDRRALAFGSKQGLAMATFDGGATWLRQGLPVLHGEELEASAHVGQIVWVCGRSGKIFRSGDWGQSFAPTRRTPFANESCVTLSFLNAAHGWAGGGKGALYETNDGGDSWNALSAPLAAPELPDDLWLRPRVGNVLRLSTAEGWVSIVELAPVHRTRTFAMRRFSQEWVERTAPVALAERLAGGSPWGDDGTVRLRDDRLIFHVGEQLVRETPLAAAGPPAPAIIRGREPLSPGRTVVWTDNAIVQTFDDGRSWSTILAAAEMQIGDRPWTPGHDLIWRVVHPRQGTDGEGEQLVELADGTVLRGWGPNLLVSKQPEFDRFTMDMIEAHRRGAPTPPGPFDCLATSASGQITFEIVHNGDCHASKHEAELDWTPHEATLDPWIESSPITLTNEQRINFVRAIADAVHRPDDTRHGSNDHLSVVLDARCGDAPPLHVELEQSDTGEPGAPYLIEQELIRQTRLAGDRK